MSSKNCETLYQLIVTNDFFAQQFLEISFRSQLLTLKTEEN